MGGLVPRLTWPFPSPPSLVHAKRVEHTGFVSSKRGIETAVDGHMVGTSWTSDIGSMPHPFVIFRMRALVWLEDLYLPIVFDTSHRAARHSAVSEDDSCRWLWAMPGATGVYFSSLSSRIWLALTIYASQPVTMAITLCPCFFKTPFTYLARSLPAVVQSCLGSMKISPLVSIFIRERIHCRHVFVIGFVGPRLALWEAQPAWAWESLESSALLLELPYGPWSWQTS